MKTGINRILPLLASLLFGQTRWPAQPLNASKAFFFIWQSRVYLMRPNLINRLIPRDKSTLWVCALMIDKRLAVQDGSRT